MDASILVIVLAVLGLIAIDLLALRYGVDSRPRDNRPNWW
jgi:hypothetical protein